MRRAVFAVGHTATSDRAVLLAAVMACGSTAALSHLHAAWIRRFFPPWNEIPLAPTHITVPPHSGKGRFRDVILHRATLPPADVTVHEAIPTTAPARTILDCATLLEPRSLERLVDQAITNHAVDVAALMNALAEHPHRRGTATVRHLLEAAERFDTVSQSEMEEAFVGLVRQAGLPTPSLNYRLADMKIDAAWPDERVAVELDGYTWHRTRYRQEADRTREAKLRRLGWVPVRYSSRQVFDAPVAVAADLAAVLAGRRGLDSKPPFRGGVTG